MARLVAILENGGYVSYVSALFKS